MDGVSDAAFRFITAKYGNPDVITTEFISVDGIAYAANLFEDFLYHEIERPVVAQLFGIEPEYFYQASQIICELGFDGVDINMGCPARTVSRRGAGAGLIKNPGLAREIIAAAKQAVQDWYDSGLNSNISSKIRSEVTKTQEKLSKLGVNLQNHRSVLPVSVKTRIGYDKVEIEDWITEVLRAKPANITIHGRTLKQMYQGEANWEALRLAGDIIRDFNSTLPSPAKITYIANGDISSPEIAKARLAETSADGLYIGRGAYGDPWIFQRVKEYLSGTKVEFAEPDIYEKARVALGHAHLHYEIKGASGFVQMRKHLAWYLRGFPGAAEVRTNLMQTNSPDEVEEVLRRHSLL